MATKGFRVKPDNLLAVAERVEKLLDELHGSGSNVPGNMPEYLSKASDAHLKAALQTVFPGVQDAYSEAYHWEFQGMQEKYKAIEEQLRLLASACRNTAQQYGAHDKYTQSSINGVDVGSGPGPVPTEYNG